MTETVTAPAAAADTGAAADAMEPAEALRVPVPFGELVAGRGRCDLLAFAADGLCPCAVVEDGNEAVFVFDVEGTRPAESILNAGRADKLRFLANVADLEALTHDFQFSLNLSNLVVDRNLRPWVLRRDVATTGNDGGVTPGFRERYLAVAGQVLGKGTYEDYLRGGADLLKHNALLSELAALDGIGAVRDRLAAAYERNVAKNAATKKLVSRSGARLAKVLIPVLVVALAACGALLARSVFISQPAQERVITASQAYIAGDPLAVQTALRGVPVGDLSFETRHVLARSYVTTLGLPGEQRDHVLSGLTLMAEGALFDFWIHLGRLEFEQALEIGQRFGDTQLQLAVYIQHHAAVEADFSIPGPERQRLLTELNQRIVELRAERESAAEELDQ